MPAFESVRRRIKNAGDLQAVVRTMKVLAAVNIRQYQRAVAALGEYCLTIDRGLHVVLKDRLDLLATVARPASGRCGRKMPRGAGNPAGSCIAVIWGSDQGLCGQLNRQVVEHAMVELAVAGNRPGQCTVLAIGARIADCCAAAGQPVAETITLPASLAGVTPLVQELLLRLDDWHTERHIDRIFLFHHEYQPGMLSRPHTVRFLPVDTDWLRALVRQSWPSRALPVFAMDPERLLAALIREHLFTRLYRACAESLASENAARLAAMQRAEKNITEHGQELRRQFQRLRQAAITDELLDIVSGLAALQPAGTAPAAGGKGHD